MPAQPFQRIPLAVLVLATVVAAGDVRVIVGFKGDADASVLEKHGAAPGRAIGNLGAMTAVAPAPAVARLRADPSVAYVEEDGFVTILAKPTSPGKPGGGSEQPAQSRPWGIDRVGGGRTTNTGAGIRIAVIDTGIDAGHVDLSDNVKGGMDFTGSAKGFKDEHGHGTHVAGTLAALDNAIGVIGVAPGAHLYAVRVLDRRGFGSWSDVAEGIAWAGDNGMQLANMSLGGGFSATVSNACSYAAGLGVGLYAAAGNGGDGNTSTTETQYPAAFPTVAAVGATNSGDGLAGFSGTGPFLEFSGPGVGVTSTYKGNAYRTWDGTSMACPHAVGVAALVWSELGSTTAADVLIELQQYTVDDLGPAGRDNGYGFGIVDYSNR